MDTGKGYFKQFPDEETLNKKLEKMKKLEEVAGGIFRKNEVLEIKGSRFRIRSIGKREMRLRLLKPE